MTPFVVKSVLRQGKKTEVKKRPSRQVISPIVAHLVTEMMVNAVNKAWFARLKPDGFKVAGKTGTAQIPIAGHYDQEKTIASFVGFAPASDPRFIMLVTLREPTSSPWGSETAAPLWFDIAKQLFVYYGVQPDL